ncbi:xanthine dehydrogenase family protein molybdopterin-binding subunit [Variovorax saccharolyticus]|uniref:xanthine dehydrogenase family protein molybdopterin-binding subunit n=1 Tax=Variovorax saccharolyticus TaxID=3053516 RepID=UPI0025787826|nr:molybdopterin cofactor-binding domain-containing protein [Variovorax sp. J22R187]MDM0021401.1 molybdopterin-dependent oxidoreductase [Variovorax sp. J22R187]
MSRHPQLSRRAILQGSGALVVGFALGPPPEIAFAQAAGRPAAARSVDPAEVGGFLAIDSQGSVTLYSGKVELGTGVLTALTQIVAEELDVPLERVATIQGDTLLTPDQHPTDSSLSIQAGGMQIRRAAATAREALLDQAAARLGVARDQLAVQAGTVAPRAGGPGVTYAALLQGRSLTMKLDPAVRTKDPKDYRIVGKPVRRLDIPAKIFGSFEFVHDVRVPDMVHARVVHPAAFGARLESWDDTLCRDIPGYLRAVRQGDFLAVLASDEWAAIRASRALVAKWGAAEGLPDEARLVAYMRGAKVDRDEVLQRTGGPSTPVAGAGRQLRASYDFPLNTHGSIGPSCAVADFKDGRLTVWTPSQASHMLRGQLATMLRLPEERVRCIYVEGAGCYGRNGADDCSSEAALIAMQAGRPVRLQWMRHDEHGWDPKGPPTLLDYRARIDPQGRIAAWEADIFLPERPMKRSGVTLLGAVLAGLPKAGPDSPGTHNPGLGIPYDLPSSQLAAHWLHDTPLPAAWIRAPGRMQNTFGNESFIDDIAAATGTDPFEYRVRHLSDKRGLELLERLRRFAGWQPRGARARDTGPLARGRGVSYAKYELVRTYVGLVADVAVDRRSGRIQVERVFVVHDCGQIINPDGLRNQLEGNVVQTVSRTLVERLAFDRSAVTSLDWASYPILTFTDVPEVAIDLIDRPGEAPWGAGEPTTSAVPSAIANAVLDATGAHLRSVPFRPATVLAALAATPAK